MSLDRISNTVLPCLLVLGAGLLVLAGCGEGSDVASETADLPVAKAVRPAGDVDDARIIAAAETEPGSWLTSGQSYKEQRFSMLTQINRDNVKNLGLAWTKPIGDFYQRMQGTPLVVDGIMYVTNGWSVVFALDAVTGEEIWSYDPKTDRSYMRLACCGPAHNRGVSVYRGRVYVATFDGRLLAIDAADGKVAWEVDTWHPSALGRFNITGVPRAAAGKIFIGQGSSESGHRRGYVTAYDADTGEIDWRFYLVPGDPSKPFEHPEMEMAAKTWGGEWWKYGGGGTAWNALVYDEELNSLYIGVGNGAPWPRKIRSPGGTDDLFLTAIISVNVETGRMNWYYQTVPGDNWDYSSAMDIALDEMTVDGEQRKVLLQAPKNGFFYVLDRESGELLRAHPYTDGITWATHIDMETGRPVENPDVKYEENPQWILPANVGAHNWEPQSWDAQAGIMYFYYHDFPGFYSLDEEFVKTGEYKIRERGLSLGWGEGEYREKLVALAAPRPESKGFIGAFDPLTGKYRWRHRLASVFNGGVLATTTGVVFQGEGTGQFVARNTDTGEPIWQYDGLGSFSSALVTYQIDEVQYIAILVGGNRDLDLPGTLLVFKLGGDQVLAAKKNADMSIPEQPKIAGTAEMYTEGNELYHSHCAQCHRSIGVVGSEEGAVAPDLRRMSIETHNEWADIVLGGSRMAQGMLSFSDTLSEAQVDSILVFLIYEANRVRNWQKSRQEQSERRAAAEAAS